MSTPLNATASFADLRTTAPLVVSAKALAALYSIIPVCAAIVAIDMLLFNQALKSFMPSNPDHWLLWTVVFNTPHILASFFSFADKEYYQFYKPRVLKALALFSVVVVLCTMVMPAILPGALSRLLSIVFSGYVIAYTMYHVLSQQLGVAVSMMKIRPGKLYGQLRWCATLAGTFMYALAVVDDELYFVGVRFGAIFELLAGICVAICCVLGHRLAKDSKNSNGTKYLYINLVMLVAVYVFWQLGYGAFVIVVPRFVHDITAFYIYAVHDRNRNRDARHNYIYRSVSFLSPLVVCPVLAIVLSAVLQTYAWFVAPLLIITLLHYYTEGFIWRGDTLHRRQVSFQ